MTAAAILPDPQSKICTKCLKSTPLTEFFARKAANDGLANKCKSCASQYAREFLSDDENLARKKARDRLYYEKNRAAILVRAKEYAEQNKDAVSACKKGSYNKKRAYYIAKVKANAATDRGKELRNKWSSEYARMRRSDPVYVLKRRIYCAISSAFSKDGYSKTSRTHEILGCDWEFFKTHIERQFIKGMSWAKFGSEIHIDHIVPLATAKSEADVVALSHFTNLRPCGRQTTSARMTK